MNLDFTDHQVSEGRKLLRRLLPEIGRKVSLSRQQEGMQPLSRIGQSLMGRIRIENLDALVIRRSAGGWHADVILTGLPLGISNVMGTPEAQPLPNREAALEAGTGILRRLCHLALENAQASRDMPERDVRPFELHGHTFEIPGEMVDKIGEVWAAVGRALVPDAASARAQLTANLVRLMGEDRFDLDIFAALPEEEKSRIGINMATLLMFREFRHPERPTAQPVAEDPSP